MCSLYSYVGPSQIAVLAKNAAAGAIVNSLPELRAWLTQAGLVRGTLTATFVIDAAGRLRLADRRSEHVACAGGGRVLSAGEITFAVRGATIDVVEVSNQSTGYCPAPASYAAVHAALSTAGIPAPPYFTLACEFRRCPACAQTNLIKDGHFACAVCGDELPAEWNFVIG